MSTVEEASRLVAVARENGLSGLELVSNRPIEDVAREYNGIGPSWFPAALRRTADAVYSEFRPPAMIHDNEWAMADGTRESFDSSNDRLRLNCEKMARASCAWYNPRRYVLLWRARNFAGLCSRFGWSAYEAACAKQRKEEKSI